MRMHVAMSARYMYAVMPAYCMCPYVIICVGCMCLYVIIHVCRMHMHVVNVVIPVSCIYDIPVYAGAHNPVAHHIQAPATYRHYHMCGNICRLHVLVCGEEYCMCICVAMSICYTRLYVLIPVCHMCLHVVIPVGCMCLYVIICVCCMHVYVAIPINCAGACLW